MRAKSFRFEILLTAMLTACGSSGGSGAASSTPASAPVTTAAYAQTCAGMDATLQGTVWTINGNKVQCDASVVAATINSLGQSACADISTVTGVGYATIADAAAASGIVCCDRSNLNACPNPCAVDAITYNVQYSPTGTNGACEPINDGFQPNPGAGANNY
jgi:hypothetical protein